MSKKKIMAWIGAGTFLTFTAGRLPVEAAGLETEKLVVPFGNCSRDSMTT